MPACNVVHCFECIYSYPLTLRLSDQTLWSTVVLHDSHHVVDASTQYTVNPPTIWSFNIIHWCLEWWTMPACNMIQYNQCIYTGSHSLIPRNIEIKKTFLKLQCWKHQFKIPTRTLTEKTILDSSNWAMSTCWCLSAQSHGVSLSMFSTNMDAACSSNICK